jgi:hypothetical protein
MLQKNFFTVCREIESQSTTKLKEITRDNFVPQSLYYPEFMVSNSLPTILLETHNTYRERTKCNNVWRTGEELIKCSHSHAPTHPVPYLEDTRMQM